MLRIVAMRSDARAVSAYFAKGDYYAEGSVEAVGEWGGEAAGKLGLSGFVEKQDFERLCKNQHPRTFEPITPRTLEDRRCGYDFSFSVPKSVSIVYSLTRSKDILEAFTNSVSETMRELEQLAETRVRLRSQQFERRTGNLVWASFTHTTARPVDGYPDPQLHQHVFVMNSTWDEVEKRWKAVDVAQIKSEAPYFQAVFESKFAIRLRALGFDVVATAKGYEIAGIPISLIEKFSRRKELIEAKAEELGIVDAKQKDALGAKTRKSKSLKLTQAELEELWWSKFDESERQAFNAVIKREVMLTPNNPNLAHEVLREAANHCFERESVVPVNKLLNTALHFGIGQLGVDDVIRALGQSGLLVREIEGKRFVTSKEVLLEERAMLSFARDGRAKCPAIHPDYAFPSDWLSLEQKNAVKNILQSLDRVILVRGAAGTGKTAMLREAVHAMKLAGKSVVLLAPSADASRGVLRNDGFHGADTLARFLMDTRFQESARRGIIVLDEAGLVGSRSMSKLFTLAKSLDARVLLLGDTRQHASVERGSALRLLETEAGLPVFHISQIRRQSGDYKRVAELLSREEVVHAFEILDGLGWIQELKAEDREKEIASVVVERMACQQSVLVISPTHAEGGKITDAIRQQLKTRGLLSLEERAFTKLTSKGLTAAERGRVSQYRVGDVVEFHTNAPGFTKGKRFTVEKTGKNSVAVKDSSGSLKILPLKLSDRFDLFSARSISIAVGDKIRITKNGKSLRSKRLDNGSVYTVRGFTSSEDLNLGDGLVMGREYAHFAFGYVSTSHASQGKTVDHVFVIQGAESFPASSKEQFYVSATRARKSLVVYTDDKAGLIRAISKNDPRLSATELMKPAAMRHAWEVKKSRRANQNRNRLDSISETSLTLSTSREVSR
ncbi:MAG: MobF family relaxase [Gemmataceae bacterium]